MDAKSKLSSANYETKLITAGNSQKESWQFVNPPIYRGSTVLYDTYESMINEKSKYVYGRWDTPTSTIFCEAMTQLEKGVGTIVTCSGLAAISTTLLALVLPGSHILISESSYPAALGFCEKVIKNFGVKIEKFSLSDVPYLSKRVLPNTALIYFDISGAQGAEVLDVREIRSQVGQTLIVVDNTWATPFFCNPLDLGGDIVIHSTSKYISGHSDSIMGCVVCGTEDLYHRVRDASRAFGQCAGPEDIYFALRGLRTLGIRMKHHQTSAFEIASWLQERLEVEKVFYSPLTTNENYSLWVKQFRGAGGVLSFIFGSKYELKYIKFLNSLNLIRLGWGWGGYESLVSSNVMDFGPYSGRVTIRMSIGLEAITDILKDLEFSFQQAFLEDS